MNPLVIQSSPHNGGIVIKIAGDAGVDHVMDLETELARIAGTKPKLVVFDLSGLDFIASLGMGVLLGFRQQVARSGGVVKIAAAKPVVLDAFKRASLKALFNACDTVDEALGGNSTHA